MAKNDKLIAAFLVSVGILSYTQAVRYLGTLSSEEKDVVLSVAKEATKKQILLCSGQMNMNVTETTPAPTENNA